MNSSISLRYRLLNGRVRYSLFYFPNNNQHPGITLRLFKGDVFLDEDKIISSVKVNVTFALVNSHQYENSTKLSKHSSIYRLVLKSLPKITWMCDKFLNSSSQTWSPSDYSGAYGAYYAWLSGSSLISRDCLYDQISFKTLGETLVNRVAKHNSATIPSGVVPLWVDLYELYKYQSFKIDLFQ